MVEFLSAVILVTNDLDRMVQFYREVVGVQLLPEHHGDTADHFGCELGDVHFAIHPASRACDLEERGGRRSIRLAFTTFDLDDVLRRIHAAGLQPLYPVEDVGFAKMTAILDPDENLLEFTQLSDKWFEHLEKRRAAGFDVLTHWKKSLGKA